MKLSFGMKQREFTPPRIKVILNTPDGGWLPVFLPVEMEKYSDADLEREALEELYRNNYPLRAEKEYYEKLQTLIKQLEEQDKANKIYMEQSVAEMTTLVTSLLAPMVGLPEMTEEIEEVEEVDKTEETEVSENATEPSV